MMIKRGEYHIDEEKYLEWQRNLTIKDKIRLIIGHFPIFEIIILITLQFLICDLLIKYNYSEILIYTILLSTFLFYPLLKIYKYKLFNKSKPYYYYMDEKIEIF